MLFKELVVTFGIISLVNSQMTDLETMYLESVKKSVDILKLQLEMKNEKPCSSFFQLLHTIENCIKREDDKDEAPKLSTLPKHSNSNDYPPPSNCKKVTENTHVNGYYNITVPRYNERSFMAFCDIEFDGGDWIYILRRQDGSENFTRPWSDYVYGFGNVTREYWIGLENLYALTNFDGPQELYVQIEDWKGETRYAKYDEFAIGSASEKYKLKTLGKYSGNTGDALEGQVGMSFSTYDSDNDIKETHNCAWERKGGWWFPNCGIANPTGIYYKEGNYTRVSSYDGMYWFHWKGHEYSYKTMNFMIRRQKNVIWV